MMQWKVYTLLWQRDILLQFCGIYGKNGIVHISGAYADKYVHTCIYKYLHMCWKSALISVDMEDQRRPQVTQRAE